MTSRAALALLVNIATDDYSMQSLEVQEAIDSLETDLALLESFKETVDKVIEKLNHKLKATEHAIYAAEMNGSNTIMLENNKQIYNELLVDINSWLKK